VLTHARHWVAIAGFAAGFIAVALSTTAQATPGLYSNTPSVAARVQNVAPIAAPSRAAADYSLLTCHQYIPYYEKALRIPSRLLESIALTESARQYPGTKMTVAWPWTVMAEGRGRYYNTRIEAITEVRKLQKRGVRNIDVGCMQVNLRAHPDAFKDLEQAFDPAYNVRYAAQFLTGLRNRHNSWVKAVGFYHSGTPDRHKMYRDKVLARWRNNFKNGTAVAAFMPPQQPAASYQRVAYATQAVTPANNLSSQQVYRNWYAQRAAGRPAAAPAAATSGKMYYVNASKAASTSQRSVVAVQDRAQFLTQRRQGRIQVYDYR
jgi:hypothetical protein